MIIRYLDPWGSMLWNLPVHNAPADPSKPICLSFVVSWGTQITPRVQAPNNHILSEVLPYITTILNPST